MEASEVKAVSHEKDSSQCVRVAVNIRPLITPELLIGCTDCISVVPGEPQVQIGSHAFTFDYVYGSPGLPYSTIFRDCVAPLVDALFHGYNATVLAYGQTGSGKTFTMGTNYTGNESDAGIIPQVMESVFSRVETMKDSTEFLIRVSFIEIFKEEVFDLLDPNSMTLSKIEAGSHVKAAVPARVPIQIRETVSGGITLSGVTEAEVETKEEMASYLSHGSLSRATGSTNMNSQSSRSHAIFTITMEQKRVTQPQTRVDDDMSDDILSAKLHLVDLAGSERAKRTGADGMRFKEGIHINKGLLALGNVISALGDEKKRKEGGHVPYRDSKLTRLLQDSLGGNSKTVMIACVSPADSNAEETLNTLKYANRARNIQNKAVINRDPVAAQMQRMRSQIEQLQAELLFLRGDAIAPHEELQILKQKNSLLEAKITELQLEVKEHPITCKHLAQRAIDAQVEKDKLIMKLESARNGKSLGEIDSNLNEDVDLMKRYVTKIQELEGKLLRLQKRSGFHDSVDLDDGFHMNTAQSRIPEEFPSVYDAEVLNLSDSGDAEDDEKELEHSSIQENLDRELKELDKKLEQKEAEMKQFTSVNTSILKQHYDKKVLELEQEKKALQKEIDELRHNLANISSASDDGAQKLKLDYLQKLNVLEAQVSELKKKQEAQSQLVRQKQKSDEAAKRLQDEIQRIKSQKVQLQHKIKQESEQFRSWKASREKEVLQLKKEDRRKEYEMHKLLALNQRQKMVLQRKSEEAAMATKRLKELLESRKTSSRETFGAGSGHGIQALMQAVEHELEVTVRVHEVRSEYEHQIEEKARMAKEVAKLKEEANIMKQKNMSCPETMSPGARNSRIFALENMLDTSSRTLVSMASQLSEAEERERIFSGRGRWNQVRSLADAKNVMNYLYNIASSSRCQLRDKEVDCRENESLVRELKEKVVKLSCLVRQLEMQKQEYNHQEASLNINSKEHAYDLRKGRNSIICGGRNELQEDMDTSDSEHSDVDWVASETETETEMLPTKKRISRVGGCSSTHDIRSNTVSLMTEPSDDGSFDLMGTSSGVCCVCSKSSSCKTLKCKCRATGGICGTSCRCVLPKCSNRGTILVKEESCDLDHHENAEGISNCSSIDEAEKSRILASHVAVLLQGAFNENSDKPSDDCSGPRRKPLSDIGNTVVKSNALKPPKGKRLKKSVIQLVPVAPPPLQPETTEAPTKLVESAVEADMPLKLPRAMPSVTSNGNQLKERNSDHSSRSNKEPGAPGSPLGQMRTSNEKENHNH